MARRLEVEIVADAAKFNRGIKQAESRTSSFQKAAGVAGAAITGALVVGLKKSVDAAKEAQVSQTRMQTQLKTLGINYKQHAAQIDTVIQSTSKLAALDDEDLQDAFTKLTRTTGNMNKGLRDTKIAADVARGAHVSLEQATKAVMGAEQGRSTALKRLGIDLGKHATKQEAIAALQKKFAGASEAYGKTAAGAQERLGVAIENLEESMGKILLPTIEKVAGTMANLAGYFEQHKTLAKVLTIAIAALGAALLTVNVATKLVSAATKVYAAMQWLLNAALEANPIGLVVIALVALAAALVVAWKKSETFRNIVLGTSDAIKQGAQTIANFVTRTIPAAFQSVLNWVRSNWKTIAVLISGPFAPLVALATNAFGIRSALVTAFNTIKTAASNVISSIVGWFGGLPGKIGAAIANSINTLKDWIGKTFNPGKIVGWIKAAMFGGSPSKPMMDVGRWMVDSIGKGVLGGADLLKDAVVRLAKKFLPSISGITSAAGGAIGAITKGGAGGLKPQVLAALSWARTHGWGGSVTSGFRSYQEQAALYQRYLHGGPLAARPGTSSHETGSAVDVTDYTTFGRIMATAPAGARLYNRLGAADPVHYSISGYARGGWAGLRGPELALLGEQGPEYVMPAGGGGQPALVVENMHVTSPAMAELVASRVMHRLAYR